MGAGYPVLKLLASPFQRLDRLAAAISVILGLTVLVDVFVYDRLFTQLDYLQVLQHPRANHLSDRGAFQTWGGADNIWREWPYAALVGVVVILAVVWLVWQYGAHANRRELGIGDDRFTPRTGIGSWFVPVANIVLPPLALRELWRTPYADAMGLDESERRTSGAIVWVWWTCLVVSVSLTIIAFVVAALGKQSIDALVRRNVLLLWALLASIGTAGLAAYIVHPITWRVLIKQDQVRFPPRWTAWGD